MNKLNDRVVELTSQYQCANCQREINNKYHAIAHCGKHKHSVKIVSYLIPITEQNEQFLRMIEK